MKDSLSFHECKCHINSEVKHCNPCCEECPNCRQNIKKEYVELHKQQCSPPQSKYRDPLDSPVAKDQPNFQDF